MFYTGGVLRGFDSFGEKAPAVGVFFNKVLRKDSGSDVFFVDFAGFLGAPCL